MKHNTCILLFAICTLLFSCAKEEPIPVQTFHVENESVSTSYHTADILIDMEENYPDGTYYVLYSTSSQMNDFQRAKLVSNGTKLSGTLTGLTEGTTYYYKLNVVGDFNTITLEQQYTFTTREYSEPLVRTGEIQSVTYTTANVSVALDEWGSDVLPEWGLCYATTVSPTLTDSKIVCPNGQETMITLNSLTDNTTYYVRAFATN
ncbi:MAG: hypothetical protein J6X51_05815, partial [Bacteroidales bacterium]|nr:hypothetical protein [Bacteroidales bacterium]